MKKKYRVLLVFLALIGIFFLIEWLIPGYLVNWLNGFIKVPFYLHLSLFIGCFFSVVLLHELAHAFAFIICGISLKIIMVLCFIFYKSDRWHISIDFKLLALGGGIVMPHFDEVKNHLDFTKYQNATAFSLLFAPVFTILFSITVFVINVVFFPLVSWLTVVNLYVMLISLFFTYTSTLQAADLYGDFVAYKKVKDDSVFGLSIVSQYVDTVSDYHLLKLRETLQSRSLYDFDIHLLNFYGLLLEKGIHEDQEPDDFLLEKTKVFARQHHTIRRILKNHQLYVLVQMAIGYLYRCNEDELVEQLFTVFDSELAQSKIKSSAKTYYQKQTKHMIGLTDESDFLNQVHDFSTGLIDDILSHLPEYHVEENTRNQPILRFKKKETIHLDNNQTL